MDADLERLYASCTLRADYFKTLFSKHDRVVCAEPCGAGKTLGVAEFISQNYKGGVLYAAQRKESLDRMEELLLALGVPENRISKYYSGSNAGSPSEVYSHVRNPNQIVLVTHARLEDDPTAYWTRITKFSSRGLGPRTRSYAIIDEPINICRIIRMPVHAYTYIVGRLAGDILVGTGDRHTELPADLTETAQFGMNKDALIREFRNPIRQFQMQGVSYAYVGSGVLDGEGDIFVDDDFYGVNELRRSVLYDRILESYMLKHYRVRNIGSASYIEVSVFTSTEIALAEACEKLVVLDATGEMTPHLHHPIKTFVRKTPWKGSIGKLTIVDGKFSKGLDPAASKKALLDVFRSLKSRISEPTLVFAWKSLEQDIQSEIPADSGWQVAHYGGTRGSNSLSQFRSVIFLGTYYKDPNYYISFSDVFGDELTKSLPARELVADILQEGYRSAIRNGEKVDWYVVTDPGSSGLLISEFSRLGIAFDEFDSLMSDEVERSGKPRKKPVGAIILSELARSPTRSVAIETLLAICQDAGYSSVRRPFDLKHSLDRSNLASVVRYEAGIAILRTGETEDDDDADQRQR